MWPATGMAVGSIFQAIVTKDGNGHVQKYQT